MTKTDREQIVAYIDAKVTYAIETLQGEFQTRDGNRSVFLSKVEETRHTLLTGKPPKKAPKAKAQQAGPTTYRYGDQQWENPAQRG